MAWLGFFAVGSWSRSLCPFRGKSTIPHQINPNDFCRLDLFFGWIMVESKFTPPLRGESTIPHQKNSFTVRWSCFFVVEIVGVEVYTPLGVNPPSPTMLPQAMYCSKRLPSTLSLHKTAKFGCLLSASAPAETVFSVRAFGTTFGAYCCVMA